MITGSQEQTNSLRGWASRKEEKNKAKRLGTHMHSSKADYKQFHARRHRLLMSLAEKHLPEGAQRALDIGGGGDVVGVAQALQKKHGIALHGVDLGDDVRQGCERGVLSKTCNVDVEPLPFEAGYFDLVLFASVIEHLYNPHTVLKEIARVLRPGGILLLEAPNAVALGRRLDALVGRNPFQRFNQYNAIQNKAIMEFCSVFYTVEEVEEALGDRFELLAEHYCMHTPPVNPVKAALRALAFRLNPRFADCFFVVARRRSP